MKFPGSVRNTLGWRPLSLLLLPALLAACAATPPPSSQGDAMRPPPPPPAATRPAQPVAEANRWLQSNFWNLVEVRDARGQLAPDWTATSGQRKPVRLQFQGTQVSVHNLCNVMNAGYMLSEGGRIEIGRSMATMRACADQGLMALEQRLGGQLSQAQRYEMRRNDSPGRASDQLVLHFADGSRWLLDGQPTPATRYGSAGERVFLEVAPERVACNHPLMPRDTLCLRVRDIRYDERGIKQTVGDWRILQGGIEGYEHQPGMRNVLRLQRYSLMRNGQLPADGPSHALVLDMVVESERVR
jgi:heat shock protein HslJ